MEAERYFNFIHRIPHFAQQEADFSAGPWVGTKSYGFVIKILQKTFSANCNL